MLFGSLPLVIVNLKKGLIIHNGKPCNVHYGMEHCSMLMQWMPVYSRQAPKALKALVNSFVICPSQGVHFLFGIVVSSMHLSPLSSIIIPSISLIAFMIIQVMINSCLCDFSVQPFSLWKWSIHPNNPPGFDADTNFILQSWPLNLWLYHLGLKGMGSQIWKSVASTIILHH